MEDGGLRSGKELRNAPTTESGESGFVLHVKVDLVDCLGYKFDPNITETFWIGFSFRIRQFGAVMDGDFKCGLELVREFFAALLSHFVESSNFAFENFDKSRSGERPNLPLP